METKTRLESGAEVSMVAPLPPFPLAGCPALALVTEALIHVSFLIGQAGAAVLWQQGQEGPVSAEQLESLSTWGGAEVRGLLAGDANWNR